MTSVKQTVTLLHRALLLLLKDSLNFSSRLQVVGAVCISVDEDSSDLVIKFNDILQRDDISGPLNLAGQGAGGAQQTSVTGSSAGQNGQSAGGKRKMAKGQKAAGRRGPSETDADDEETKPPRCDVAGSCSEASSENDPSYAAAGKRRKSGPGAAPATKPGPKRRAASNGSAEPRPAEQDVKPSRQSLWQNAAGSRKRSPCSCQVCGMVFCSRAVLERHALRHFGVRPYECGVCNERFYRKDQALTHVKKSHDGCTPAEAFVAEKVGKTESRQLIEQLAHANAAASGADDEAMDECKPDPLAHLRSVGVAGLPTFVGHAPASGGVRFDGSHMLPEDSDPEREPDDDDPDVVRNDDELDDDEDDPDNDVDQRNSPIASNDLSANASDGAAFASESLSSLIQQKRTRAELLPRGVGVGVDRRPRTTDALHNLENEGSEDEQRGRAADENDAETDEDVMLRHADEEPLFSFAGGAISMPTAIDNDDEGASSVD